MTLEMKYFVLKPRGDSPFAHASRAAMRMYAGCIKDTDPEFAGQLIKWINKEATLAVRDLQKGKANETL